MMKLGCLTSKEVLQENKTSDTNAVTSLTFTHRALTHGLKDCVNLKWLSVKQNKLRTLKGIESCLSLTVNNEIVSICKLDQMKELNTLVLSKNPIQKIGESLVKVNSITKLSLSNCKIQAIDSSIKSCTELRELRLAHNEIRTLPSELTRNTKIQNLDLGNNLILRWSDLKVLSSLGNLKNLNLAGNPVIEKDVTTKKIKKLVPSLQIFNARPIDKPMKNLKAGTDDHLLVDAGDNDKKKELKMKKHKPNRPTNTDHEETATLTDLNSEKKSKRKSKDEKDRIIIEEESIHKSKKVKHDDENVRIDALDYNEDGKDKRDEDAMEKKKKVKSKTRGSSAALLLLPEVKVGLGGQSAWDVDG
ncbi:leucine-rich repeat domain, L domain-like protein [Artemisia annua]|uniref:Leucine-rich repeat domain, L domain-like protein n=1 Tax=Artemisia annua TaxID=35608 RepID=A0A2U1NX80_ARTAN|nr:leucine-rich repeat domain, L domain-like protein [Artemisia annua]